LFKLGHLAGKLIPAWHPPPLPAPGQCPRRWTGPAMWLNTWNPLLFQIFCQTGQQDGILKNTAAQGHPGESRLPANAPADIRKQADQGVMKFPADFRRVGLSLDIFDNPLDDGLHRYGLRVVPGNRIFAYSPFLKGLPPFPAPWPPGLRRRRFPAARSWRQPRRKAFPDWMYRVNLSFFQSFQRWFQFCGPGTFLIAGRSKSKRSRP
jgi:hypothetical protein